MPGERRAAVTYLGVGTLRDVALGNVDPQLAAIVQRLLLTGMRVSELLSAR